MNFDRTFLKIHYEMRMEMPTYIQCIGHIGICSVHRRNQSKTSKMYGSRIEFREVVKSKDKTQNYVQISEYKEEDSIELRTPI